MRHRCKSLHRSLHHAPTPFHTTYDAGGKLVMEYSTIVETDEAKVGYLTNDHLGSPRINTGVNGHVTSRHDYHPFGEEITTTQRTGGVGYADDEVRKQFTGYERDGETELDFAQARMYAKALCRFTTVDPVPITKQRLSYPQRVNLYAYGANSPVVFADTTGEDIIQITRSSVAIQEEIDNFNQDSTCLPDDARSKHLNKLNEESCGLPKLSSRG